MPHFIQLPLFCTEREQFNGYVTINLDLVSQIIPCEKSNVIVPRCKIEQYGMYITYVNVDYGSLTKHIMKITNSYEKNSKASSDDD